MKDLLAAAPLIAVALAAMPGTASAQSTTGVPPFSIRVTGEATVTAPPDQADIDIGVITRGETAQRAAEANARETTRVFGEVKKRLGPNGTAQTVGYSVQPEYRYPREGREPQIAGYLATAVLRITTSNLDGVGELVDVAVGAGVNRVQRMQFTLKDEQSVYVQALREAASRARAEADALASALGLTIVRVLSAVEESGPVRPFVDAARPAALAAESATPIEPGTVDVDARVRLTMEVTGSR